MHSKLGPVARFLVGLTRPSPQANRRLLRDRGETLASFTIRDAVPEDIPALVRLHVETWNATYPSVLSKPTVAVRDRQWRDRLGTVDGSWFCLIVVRRDGELVGFVRLLVGHAARRFLSQGISSAIVFTDPPNPSGAFFDALGADKLLDNAGSFRGAYGWRDLQVVVSRCPIYP